MSGNERGTATASRAGNTDGAAGKRDGANIALTVWGVIMFAFLFLPILVVVVYSFNNGRLLASWDSFGFQAYVHAFTNDVMKSSVLTSLKAAVGTAILATIFGTLGGIALARAKHGAKWALGLTALLAISLVTPEIVDAIAMLPWFVSLGVDHGITPLNNGLVRLIIAHTVESMAVVTFIIRARMAGLDESLEEAAGDLYATPWRRFRDITLPMAGPGIMAGALMGFTLSLDNTIVSSFVQQPGYTPWPVYIFSQVRVALRPEVAALSTVMLVLTLIALAVVGYVLRRVGENTSDIVKTMTGES
ncbi:ABC transporter permease [Spelaeicoccus albus]|uniref:Spermidine/putrescine transport system permease protein PotC n=1 Tax=Spelaeicoccus albus TaxID=1280376 RepID=A0A7Z0ABW4_9MICO|nr:ABC transporter permease [Spelaeicoccus albus]NYI66306.1 ABC-type spermidine/putrescine transport system permease subunit II [Spelaeicoccus albus]